MRLPGIVGAWSVTPPWLSSRTAIYNYRKLQANCGDRLLLLELTQAGGWTWMMTWCRIYVLLLHNNSTNRFCVRRHLTPMAHSPIHFSIFLKQVLAQTDVRNSYNCMHLAHNTLDINREMARVTNAIDGVYLCRKYMFF